MQGGPFLQNRVCEHGPVALARKKNSKRKNGSSTVILRDVDKMTTANWQSHEASFDYGSLSFSIYSFKDANTRQYVLHRLSKRFRALSKVEELFDRLCGRCAREVIL